MAPAVWGVHSLPPAADLRLSRLGWTLYRAWSPPPFFPLMTPCASFIWGLCAHLDIRACALGETDPVTSAINVVIAPARTSGLGAFKATSQLPSMWRQTPGKLSPRKVSSLLLMIQHAVPHLPLLPCVDWSVVTALVLGECCLTLYLSWLWEHPLAVICHGLTLVNCFDFF